MCVLRNGHVALSYAWRGGSIKSECEVYDDAGILVSTIKKALGKVISMTPKERLYISNLVARSSLGPFVKCKHNLNATATFDRVSLRDLSGVSSELILFSYQAQW